MSPLHSRSKVWTYPQLAQVRGLRGVPRTKVAPKSGPAPAVAGLRFSLEAGHGRSAVPVRSVLVGSVLAVTVVVATVTFASGLNTLVSHPALYGWNWNFAIEPEGG